MSDEAPLIDARCRAVDLGYALDEHTVAWPGAGEGFSLCMTSHGASPVGGPDTFYSAGTFRCAEHAGTHVDAPWHFHEHGATVDALELSRLVAPAHVLRTARADVTAATVLAHEAAHGALPRGCIVLCDTGWAAEFALGAAAYLGFAGPGLPADASALDFPGIARDAAELLALRGVAAVGIDTASLDPGACRSFDAHRVLLSRGVYGIENLTGGVTTLPPRGFTVVVMPMKIAGGSGAPARVIAYVPPAAEVAGQGLR